MILGKTFKFDAAHRLYDHKGKCKNLHGHTYKITVEVKAEMPEPWVTSKMELTKYGIEQKWVMDLGDLTKIVNAYIEKFDHKDINDVLEEANPTCEILAEYLFKEIDADLVIAHKDSEVDKPVRVHSITVQEGDGGYARYEG